MTVGVSIRARGLVKTFDGGLVRALAGIDLEVQGGERVAIMGPTGCGKSTLLGLIALLDQPDEGSLELDGKPSDLARPAEGWRAANVGFAFQFHHLLPHLTAVENVCLPLMAARPRPADMTAVALAELDRLGLVHRSHQLAGSLSGGERQLVAVARALVNRPRLVLADEPTGNVDSETAERLLGVLVGWSIDTSATLVLVTHDAAVAARADRLVRMRDGRVLEEPAPH
jgi:ABC-type lipoprotein export system ATPase subunit